MYRQKPNVDNEKRKQVILIAILVLITVIALAFLVVEGNLTEKKPIKKYTSLYTNISAQAAYDLIKTKTNNLIIIDVRSCKCNYDKEHIGDLPLFESIHNTSWYSYYNKTDDLLVYDTYGNQESIEFCENLVNHTYGEIFNLDGGITAWKKLGFPTI
jgi:rhodanese-related sulfurtransferase